MPLTKQQWLFLGLSALLPLAYRQATDGNYRSLEALLAAKKWQAADQKTTEIILRESNWGASTWKMWGSALISGERTGWYEPIKQYPCRKLIVLDNLWLKHSQGQFGLSVQQQIFQRIAAQSNNEFSTYSAFTHKVQWDGSNDLSEFPMGHFPSTAWVQATTYGKGEPWMLSAAYLYDRIEECRLPQ